MDDPKVFARIQKSYKSPWNAKLSADIKMQLRFDNTSNSDTYKTQKLNYLK